MTIALLRNEFIVLSSAAGGRRLRPEAFSPSVPPATCRIVSPKRMASSVGMWRVRIAISFIAR